MFIVLMSFVPAKLGVSISSYGVELHSIHKHVYTVQKLRQL
jgi:hypothetical protein